MSGTSRKINKKKIKGRIEENRKTKTGKMLIRVAAGSGRGFDFSLYFYTCSNISIVYSFIEKNQFQVVCKSNVKGNNNKASRR